jgi:hypothetical protein
MGCSTGSLKMSTFESVRDNNHDIHIIEVPECFYCHLPVRGPEGHKTCIRQAKERELIASMEWRRKQEEKLRQDQEEWEKSRPKSQQELLH